MRNLRNVAIVMLLAVVVAFAPAGGNAADTIVAALAMGFLAILYAPLGLIASLIAGSERLFSSGAGTLARILLLGASVAAIWRIWIEAGTTRGAAARRVLTCANPYGAFRETSDASSSRSYLSCDHEDYFSQPS
jgi:hypothetical protein